MNDRSAEIEAAYAAATPGLGAGHALEARLIGPAAYAARLAAARDAVNDAGSTRCCSASVPTCAISPGTPHRPWSDSPCW